MQSEAFKVWLESRRISSADNYISRLKKVEEYEGDLDAIFDLGRCDKLIAKYTYTRENQTNREKPKHNIPQTTASSGKDLYESYYEGTNDYKNRISKYFSFRKEQTTEDNSLTIAQRLKAACNNLLAEGKLVNSDKLRQNQTAFYERFNPQILRNLDGDLLLETIFNISNHNSLFYWLEFKNDDGFNTFLFGIIAGGSAFKYIMYRRKEDERWVTGNPKDPTFLSVAEAVELGRKIRDALVTGADEINDLGSAINESDYIALAKKLKIILAIDDVKSDMSALGWVHKYYHMIYPDIIDYYHSTKWQNHGLICCGIKPEGNNMYIMSGQYKQFAKECGLIPYHIAEGIYELFGGPVNYYRVGTRDDKISYWNDMLTGGYIAIGWPKLGNLREYEEQDRTGLKTKIVNTLAVEYPNDPRNWKNCQTDM